MIIKFAKINEDAIIPFKKHPSDAGLDLYSIEDVEVPPFGVHIVRTGIIANLPRSYFFGWITNKSRNDFLIGGGIIDNEYQGELLVKIINPSDKPIEIKKGQGIAQLILLSSFGYSVEAVASEQIHEVETARGSSGGIVDQIVEELGYEEMKERDLLHLPIGGSNVGYPSDKNK